jgi:hypothetical protein
MKILTKFLGPHSRWLCAVVIGSAIMAGLGGCNTLQSIEVSSIPARTVYGQGQELSQAGLVVMGHFKKESRDVTNEAVVSGYNKDQPGEQTVTVTVNAQSGLVSSNASNTFTVTVVPVEKVAIAQLPSVTVFMQGDDFDPAGLSALAEFEGAAVPAETLAPGRLAFSGYDKNKAGAQTITADYYGKRTSFEVRVAALTKIAVASPPDKTDYFTGEDLELAGLMVMGTWEGIGERPVNVTPENLSSFDQNRAGKQDVFVSYQGKTTSFPVTFVSMQVLSISRPPEKLNYENGEELDLAGLMVQGTRTGATSIELVDVDRLKISGYDRFKGGNQTISITLGGKSDTFRVTVAPNPFTGTWHGTLIRTSGQATMATSMTLIMSEDSWSLSWERTAQAPADEYSGTYTRDSDRGKSADLQLLKYGFNRDIAPTAAVILSLSELHITGGTFGRDGLTFTR